MLDEEMKNDDVTDVAVEPKVEETDETADLPDANMENDDAIHGFNKISAGVTAVPHEPEQDPQMMEIEAQVLDVLADATMADSAENSGASIAPEQSEAPITGESSSSASRPPLPRLRGKGQAQGTPARAPVTGSFLKKEEDNDDSDLKFSGKGKGRAGRLIRELQPNPEYKNVGVEIEEVLGKYPYPDHLLKAIGNGNIQLLEESLGRNATQYTLHHITGHRYYEYEDYHVYPWEWDCSWPKHIRKGISGLISGAMSRTSQSTILLVTCQFTSCWRWPKFDSRNMQTALIFTILFQWQFTMTTIGLSSNACMIRRSMRR